jgi:hypothetical protein
MDKNSFKQRPNRPLEILESDQYIAKSMLKRATLAIELSSTYLIQ